MHYEKAPRFRGWRWGDHIPGTKIFAYIAAIWLVVAGAALLCSIDFGLAHLTAVWTVVPMIPKWMPFGVYFWAVFTGIAFVLAGAAIVSGVLDVLAARLLGLMLLLFSALALAPLIFSSPQDHASWGANAYNLTAIGAAWIVAEWLATRQWPVLNSQPARSQ